MTTVRRPSSLSPALAALLLTLAGRASAAGDRPGAEPAAELSPTGAVRRISIVTGHVSPSVIRRELTFTEGDALTAEKLRRSRENIHRLGLLKSLDVSASWNDGLGGYDVAVRASDGWFVLPVPAFGSRSGEPFAGLMIVERNLFRRSEGAILYGSYSQGRSAGFAGLFAARSFAYGGFEQLSREEYAYADGGYNTKLFEYDLAGERPEKFGVVAGRYRKDLDVAYVSVGGKPCSWLRPQFWVNSSTLSYSDAEPSAPGDAGTVRAWTLLATLGPEGRVDPSAQGGLVAIGRMLGLGMAAVKDSLEPLPAAETVHNLDMQVERAEPALGSDFAYSRALAAARHRTVFRDRGALTLALKAAGGDGLPPARLLSTSQKGMLYGAYAREYRGDRIAAATASYMRPFFRNMLGLLTAEVFADSARCWSRGDARDKQGVGFGAVYRFWRFPLPFGGSAAYSLDDRNWQFMFAVGGPM